MTETLIVTQKSRQTGLPISVISNESNPPAQRYSARCDEHSKQTHRATRREAHAAARVPQEWCATCKRKVTKK